MVYIICFFIALLLLCYITIYGKILDFNIVLLIVVLAISNGGYFALAMSENLQEAILANKLCYILGIFSPIMVFFIICNVCQLYFPKNIRTLLYGFQLLIYMSACTMGKTQLFYKTVEFHTAPTGSYLTKTYGPMHTVYMVTLVVYTVAGVAAGMYSIKRKGVVSRINVDILIFVDVFSVGVYLLERMIHIEVELMPVASTLTAIIMAILLVKISVFTGYNNQEIFSSELSKKAYIIFNKNLKFMGCSDRAKELFPELVDWELEKKIPGNGGRFNTFLRPSLMNFVNDGSLEKTHPKTFEYKNHIYSYEIGKMRKDSKRLRGYYILVSDVTEVLKKKHSG